MGTEKNYFARAFDALVAGRQRQAQRFVDQFERQHAKLNDKLMKR